MSTTKSIHKHRISLSLPQIKHLIKLVLNESPISSTSLTLGAVLQVAETKIESGIRVASHTVAPPRVSTLESLGGATGSTGSTDTHTTSFNTEYILGGVDYKTKEQYWCACYHVWKNTEDKSDISVGIIRAANEWRYLQDLMTEEEICVFERGDTA